RNVILLLIVILQSQEILFSLENIVSLYIDVRHLASKHISHAINGYNLNDGPEPLCQMIDRIYQGNAKKAITTAIRIICDKYRNYRIEYELD
ncbi:MAG: DUF3870 domain-containing protein, partial [Selenomonadales bacterium]|nr:DUF3870 domain-containing protein [Selenomonadales bacterium]